MWVCVCVHISLEGTLIEVLCERNLPGCCQLIHRHAWPCMDVHANACGMCCSLILLCPSRLTTKQLLCSLKASLGGRDSSELSSEYEEFFLNNADDIAELLKKSSHKSSANSSSHLQAQQLVCTMIQVQVK